MEMEDLSTNLILHKNNNEKVPSWEGQVSDSSETGVGIMALSARINDTTFTERN